MEIQEFLGVTIKEEGSIVGNPYGVTSIDFIGVAITAVGVGAGVLLYMQQVVEGRLEVSPLEKMVISLEQQLMI